MGHSQQESTTLVKWLNTIGKQYVGGEVEHIHICDPYTWSKLEVDDALEKVGADVRGLDYYFLKPSRRHHGSGTAGSRFGTAGSGSKKYGT